MKLLVFGLDGVDADLIHRFDMPFLQGLLADNSRTSHPIHEDLWSRGWAKIISGLPGEETGAFYEKPLADGTTRFTQGFSTSDYEGLRNPPLWNALHELGIRAGWFGIPTSMPAVPVDGFMLAGAGGGYSPAGRLPEAACHPTKLRTRLAKDEFIWENRFCASGAQTAEHYLSTCTSAIWRRARLYREHLAEFRPIDFGFFFEKESVLIANIFWHDVVTGSYPRDLSHARLVRQIESFYASLDESLEYLANEVSPDRIGLVSDHGTTEYARSYNLNAWLCANGFLAVHEINSASYESSYSKVVRRCRRSLQQFRFGTSETAFPPAEAIDFTRTIAFAHFYSPGIYLNDERFGGSPMDSPKRDKLTATIISNFNEDKTANQHGFSARIYRDEHRNAGAKEMLPEIWIDTPEEYFPEQKGKFVQPNPYRRSWTDLRYLDRDIATGKKSANALCNFECTFVPDDHASDLTAAYRIILRHFE